MSWRNVGGRGGSVSVTSRFGSLPPPGPSQDEDWSRKVNRFLGNQRQDVDLRGGGSRDSGDRLHQFFSNCLAGRGDDMAVADDMSRVWRMVGHGEETLQELMMANRPGTITAVKMILMKELSRLDIDYRIPPTVNMTDLVDVTAEYFFSGEGGGGAGRGGGGVSRGRETSVSERMETLTPLKMFVTEEMMRVLNEFPNKERFVSMVSSFIQRLVAIAGYDLPSLEMVYGPGAEATLTNRLKQYQHTLPSGVTLHKIVEMTVSFLSRRNNGGGSRQMFPCFPQSTPPPMRGNFNSPPQFPPMMPAPRPHGRGDMRDFLRRGAMPARGGVRAPGPGYDRRPGYRRRWSPDNGGPGLERRWSPGRDRDPGHPRGRGGGRGRGDRWENKKVSKKSLDDEMDDYISKRGKEDDDDDEEGGEESSVRKMSHRREPEQLKESLDEELDKLAKKRKKIKEKEEGGAKKKKPTDGVVRRKDVLARLLERKSKWRKEANDDIDDVIEVFLDDEDENIDGGEGEEVDKEVDSGNELESVDNGSDNEDKTEEKNIPESEKESDVECVTLE